MRVGDFIRDPEQNENLKVTLNEIEYSEIFEGIPLKDGSLTKMLSR